MNRDTFLLVDGSSLFVRAFSVLPENKRTMKDITHMVLIMLKKAVRETKASYLTIALDSIEECWRYEYHPKYKDGRKHTDISPKQLTQVLGPVLRERGVGLLYQKFMEADDLLNTAVAKFSGDGNVVVYTRDSDMYAVLGATENEVRLLWPEKGGELRFIRRSDVEVECGHNILWMPQVRALIADRKDNLRGILKAVNKDIEIPKRWPITRPRAVEIMKFHDGDLFDIIETAIADVPTILKDTEKTLIVQHADAIGVMWEIARLRTDAKLRINPRDYPVREMDLKVPE